MMATNDENLGADAIGTYLLQDIHESKLNSLIENVSTAEFDQLLSDGMSAVRSHQHTTWSVSGSAKELGMDLTELGEQLRLSAEIVQKLDLRLLRVMTLPERLFEMLSDALLVPIEHIRSYVALPPAVPAGIRFLASDGDPSIVLESFEAALLDEDEMSEEDRKFWLGDQC